MPNPPAMASPPFLVLDQLSKRFGAQEVLKKLSLTIAQGEIFALLGPSGSGKTTALRLLAGFETPDFEAPDGGSIRVAGEDVTRLPSARRRFGMVFQHYALFPHLSVGENVAFGLVGQDGPKDRAAIAERVARALARVELAGFEARPVTALSGGQQQRVAVARALAPEPRVLLLDEPLSNLDPALRERTRRTLATTIREVGITTVLVTHEQDEAFDLGDRVGVLHSGRLEQVGTPEELYERPESRFVASFVGRGSFLPGTLRRTAAGDAVSLPGSAGPPAVWAGQLAGGAGVASEESAPAELFVRPEGLQLAAPGSPGSLSGQVVDRRYGGAQTLYTVSLTTEVEPGAGGEDSGRSAAHSPESSSIAPGSSALSTEVEPRAGGEDPERSAAHSPESSSTALGSSLPARLDRPGTTTASRDAHRREIEVLADGRTARVGDEVGIALRTGAPPARIFLPG